jgi:hypothetical protein
MKLYRTYIDIFFAASLSLVGDSFIYVYMKYTLLHMCRIETAETLNINFSGNRMF